MDRIKMRPTSNNGLPTKLLKHDTTKEEMNSTPIRTRDLPNKQNNNFANNRNKEMQRRISIQESNNVDYPYDSLMSSKTVPKRKAAVSPRSCVNHAESEAEFKIEIQGETYGYCGKCAAHLASNGFPVEKVTPSRSPKLTKQVRPPHNKKRQELSVFLNSLRQLQQDYQLKYEAIEGVKTSYQKQRQNIGNFYSQMFDYISYIRDEHLQFLDQESQRSNQICEIQTAEISETLEEIGSMKGDIESNIDKIVEEVEEESYVECMSYYKQKREVHQHRLEELGQAVSHANFSTPEFIDQKLNSFKDFVDDITGILSSKASVEY